MSASFKPMLACNADLSKLKYPLLASPKFDGIRCVVRDGRALTRNLKPIPNEHIRGLLEHCCDRFDGELVMGSPTAKDCFQRTTSAVMSKDGRPAFTFWVFDSVSEAPFEQRLKSAECRIHGFGAPFDRRSVPHTVVHGPVELDAYESFLVAEGWEGVMLRDPNGLYKCGRSTVKEGGLLKLKRFADAEAVIIGFEERLHNANAATVDALGHVERSTHKAGMQFMDELGAFIVRCGQFTNTFAIGSGFTADQRSAYWKMRDQLVGERVTFKYQEIGTKDAPRFPVFKGFRPEGA